MYHPLDQSTSELYERCQLEISEFKEEKEGKAYAACRFRLDGQIIISRKAKLTPKKIGQFVTFWKRNKEGITAPFQENDPFDFFAITVASGDRLGQFVFSKSTLIDKKLVSTELKEGKRGFRVYPPWDTAINKQAIATQKWQLEHFYKITDTTDLHKVRAMYGFNQG